MKNLIFSLVLGIVLISCDSCHDDYNPPVPPVVVKQYTIEAKNDSAIGGTITPSSVTVNSGSDVTLTITPDFGCLVKELKVNGTVVTLTTPTTYILKNVTADTKAVVTFKKTLNWYLTQKPWIKDSLSLYTANGLIYKFDLRPTKFISTFLTNGRMNASLNGNTGGDVGVWLIDETKKPNVLFSNSNIISSDPDYEIIRLDENIMILNALKGVKAGSGDKSIEYYSHNLPK